jgi:hypothetical protein
VPALRAFSGVVGEVSPGTVKKMTADEFNAAPKGAKK